VLIPIQDQIVLKVDKANKKVYCLLPEGLLDIYLED
jgi:16S rRNA processing protein RimM